MSNKTLKEPWNFPGGDLDKTQLAYTIPLGAPFSLPDGWEVVYDHLPNFEPTQLHPDEFEDLFKLVQLSEDLWHARSKDREWAVDLGWYPEGNLNGCFKVILVHGVRPEDWQNPLYVFQTRVLQEALDWIRGMLRQSFRK